MDKNELLKRIVIDPEIAGGRACIRDKERGRS